MTEETIIYTYTIDASDKINFVSAEWLQFAAENDAAELTKAKVMGKSIWNFISGGAVRRVYQDLIVALRSNSSEVVLPLRLDSPSIVRDMELRVSAQVADEIEFEGRIVSHRKRSEVAVLSREAERSDETVSICSFCRRVEVEAQWVELGTKSLPKGFGSGPAVPRLNEIVCPECDGRLRR